MRSSSVPWPTRFGCSASRAGLVPQSAQPSSSGARCGETVGCCMVGAKGVAKQDAFLDDHAFLAGALLDLYEATGENLHLERARELIEALETRFHDEVGSSGTSLRPTTARPWSCARNLAPMAPFRRATGSRRSRCCACTISLARSGIGSEPRRFSASTIQPPSRIRSATSPCSRRWSDGRRVRPR